MPRTTTPQHPRPPSVAGSHQSRPSTGKNNPKSNWDQFELRQPSSRSYPHTPSSIVVDMPVTPVPSIAGELMNERPPSRSSAKLNPLYDGSKDVAPAGFVNEYRGNMSVQLYLCTSDPALLLNYQF